MPISGYTSPAKSGRELVQICLSGAYLVQINSYLSILIVMRSEDIQVLICSQQRIVRALSVLLIVLDCQYANHDLITQVQKSFLSWRLQFSLFLQPIHHGRERKG